jgi:CHAT domain-containing protein
VAEERDITRDLPHFGDPCREAAPKPVNFEAVMDDIRNYCESGAYPYESVFCMPDMLFERGRNYMNMGFYTEAIELIKKAIAMSYGAQVERYRPHLAMSYAAIGDFSAARRYMGGGHYGGFRSTSGRYQVRINHAVGQATLARLEGDYTEAEKYYRKAKDLCQRAGKKIPSSIFINTELQFTPDLAEVLMMQGRPVEAELILRDLLHDHSWRGNAVTILMRARMMLGRIYFQQGRYKDAEVMTQSAIGGFRFNGFKCASLDLNLAHHNLAQILIAQGRSTEALEQFETIQHNLRHSPRIFEVRFANDPDWAYALIAKGNFIRAETMLSQALQDSIKQYGDGHHRAAEIRGLLAVAQHRQGKTKLAEKNFSTALPRLLQFSPSSGVQAESRGAFNRRLSRIAEAYMAFIATNQNDSEMAAQKTFPVAEAIRGQSVQQAVIATSTRIAAKDNRLGDLVRREQDAGKKIVALSAVLLNARSQSDGGTQRADDLANEIEQLHQARAVILDEIEAEFPTYAELTQPKEIPLAAVKDKLRPDEALLSFFIGDEMAFAWSVTGRGPSEFRAVKLDTVDIGEWVSGVRNSVQPPGTSLEALPEFDIQAAYRLYQTLLLPVHPSWNRAKHLIIVPHGALGHLPFGLLPTRDFLPKADEEMPFREYRQVPWLIRNHSITVLPSSGTLITLRALPKTESTRRAYAGFGDPVFSQSQAASGAKNLEPITMRAIRITGDTSLDETSLKSATLEMLRPLPDTREEVLAIANALNADLDKDVYLGMMASETNLKKLDLSNRRVLVFATHGLVPGDLDGLRQPALAFSSPSVTGDVDNDGLLTMGEIMGLRLNADWVVLSACNTAAGQSVGSEAVSGLGQAFFYAGTRALLVSNWAVESTSARMLTTALFKQQETDLNISRAEALQKSMIELMDEGVHYDRHSGKAAYAYAHPFFWAPFSLVGEGGSR